MTTLGNVCDLRNGRAYKKEELLELGRYPVLRVGNFFTNKHWYYSDLELDQTKYCDDGDLLYAWSASFGPRIWNGGKVIFHYHIWRVDHDEKQAHKGFLRYWFEWDAESIKKDQGAGTTMVHVSMKSMNARPIALPPLPEQKRIVAILDEAFAAIATATANTEKNLANARELFESELNRVFSQRGDGWVEKRLGEVFDIGSSKRILKTDWTSSGVPFYGGKEIVRLAKFGSTVSDTYISEEKYRDYASKHDIPRKGDVLITARGTIGVGYVVKEGDKFCYKDGNIIFLREKTPTNPLFILYAFRSKLIIEQFSDLTGTTVTHLPIEKAKILILMMPSFATQNFVVEHLRNTENETQRLKTIYQHKIATLKELKQSILHKAFTGELTSDPKAVDSKLKEAGV